MPEHTAHAAHRRQHRGGAGGDRHRGASALIAISAQAVQSVPLQSRPLPYAFVCSARRCAMPAAALTCVCAPRVGSRSHCATKCSFATHLPMGNALPTNGTCGVVWCNHCLRRVVPLTSSILDDLRSRRRSSSTSTKARRSDPSTSPYAPLRSVSRQTQSGPVEPISLRRAVLPLDSAAHDPLPSDRPIRRCAPTRLNRVLFEAPAGGRHSR